MLTYSIIRGMWITLVTVVLAARLGAAEPGGDAAPPAAGKAAQPPGNAACLECHSDKTLTTTNKLGKEISLFVDEALLKASAHKTNSCQGCHTDLKETHPDDNVAAKPVDCGRCHERYSASYGSSVHGLAVKAGSTESATCKDCHGSHQILSPTVPESPLHFSKLSATCGECHPEAVADVKESVHGKSTARGHREAATCSDCHAEHRIERLKGASPMKVAGEICSKCHASERLNTKFRLPANKVKTYFESYHGLAAQHGLPRAANCASCHGVHKILPSSDPRSSIHPSQLLATCGKCHPGANEGFVQQKVHFDDMAGNDVGSVVNRWVRRIYLGLIFVTIGGMVLHNFAVWARKALASLRSRERTVERMSRSQRWQHAVLVVSFIVLAWSGFALKWPDSWIARILGSDEMVRRLIHRSAAIAMLVGSFYHLWYIAFTSEGRRLVRDLWPRPADAKDALANVRHLAGAGKRPQFGRFGYVEKMEYWAVIWGTIIMTITGFIIWFKMQATEHLPGWTVDVATTVHYYEAVLACLAIFAWHFYHVIFDPDVYPLNWAWLDGKVTEHWHREEHGADLSAPGLTQGGAAHGPNGSVGTDTAPTGGKTTPPPSNN